MPIGAIIGAGSSLVSGLIGSHGASKAASAQAAAAEKARKTIETGQGQARDFQNNIWDTTQAAEKPYQAVGSTAANNLVNLLQGGFKAPTLEEVQNDPAYQFRLKSGTDAITRNSAASGTLFSGNTGKALEDYGQDLANSTYQQDYQNALNTYMANYQSLLGGTNVGENSTAQLGSFGQSAANNMTGIDLGGSEAQAQQINNAAAARASGYVGSANSWNNAVPGIGAGIMQGVDWYNQTHAASL
jgi:hypothetical protein